MGALFKFELMPESHPDKFEVISIMKQKAAIKTWSELIVAIAVAYPEWKETIVQQVGIEVPEQPVEGIPE